MKTSLCLLAVIILTGCTLPKMTNVQVLEQPNDCVYINNLDELIRGYVNQQKKIYSGNLGYQGTELGGSLERQDRIIRLQDQLSQQAATIRAVTNGIIIMHNKSCHPDNLAEGWRTMRHLINSLETAYTPVVKKITTSSSAWSIPKNSITPPKTSFSEDGLSWFKHWQTPLKGGIAWENR